MRGVTKACIQLTFEIVKLIGVIMFLILEVKVMITHLI